MPLEKPPQRARVLIVGAGPTGCTLALLLARAGIESTLIEQNSEPQQHPAASILNTRTMEVFREIGMEQQVQKTCQNIFEQALITWVVSLAGRELGRCSALPNDVEAVLSLSPTHTVQLPQNKLEPMLWRAVEAQPGIEFRKGCRVRAVQQDANGVSAIAIDGNADEVVLRGDYMVASDGASSQVRRSLNILMDGPVLQYMIGVHFEADLGHLVNDRKSILYWVLNKELVGVLLAHWLPTEWVLFSPYFPPQQTPEQFTKEVAREWIRVACGFVPAGLAIKASRPWVLAARLARSFKQGRVFLAGDAAHSFPPTGGYGLNTGVQDAHNLAWKLAAVLKGRVQPALLDTYQSERRPVARANLDHSVNNFSNMNALYQVVGLDWNRLKTLETVQSSRIFRSLPSRLQQNLVKHAVKFGLKPLSRLDAEGQKGDGVRERFRGLLPGQEPHYRSLGLDLGFAYAEGAVISSSMPKPEAANPVVDYLPTTWPGARLPHLWVRRGADRLSLLDLPGGEAFLLLTGTHGRQSWRDAVTAVERHVSVPLVCLSIGPDASSDLVDDGQEWTRLSEIGATGAILVRPDGHVAWRCSTPPSDPARALFEAINEILCHTNRGKLSIELSQQSGLQPLE